MYMTRRQRLVILEKPSSPSRDSWPPIVSAVGPNIAMQLRTRSVAFICDVTLEKDCVLKRMPPRKNADPRTSNMFERILPNMESWTNL